MWHHRGLAAKAGSRPVRTSFRSHDIDAGILTSLTAEDLRELGVRSIGHRRKLLEAIAALSEARALSEEASAPANAVSAERPPVTFAVGLAVRQALRVAHPIPSVIHITRYPHREFY